MNTNNTYNNDRISTPITHNNNNNNNEYLQKTITMKNDHINQLL